MSSLPRSTFRASTFLAGLVLTCAASTHSAAQCRAWSPGLATPGWPSGFTDATSFDDGNGEALYACGFGPGLDTLTGGRVLRWSGARWEAIYTSSDNVVSQICGGVIAGAPMLVASRRAQSGGLSTLMVWDGASWTDITAPTAEPICMEVLDTGAGPALYVGGSFTQWNGLAGTLNTFYIAKWDGSAWSALGNGALHAVRALCVHDDGTGPQLYAGLSVNQHDCVAHFDGASWTTLPSAIFTSHVQSITSCDFGAGPRLVITGATTSDRVEMWDGNAWTNLSGTAIGVGAACTADFGSGVRLYVAGDFTTIGGVACANVASYDGTSFAPLGSGIGATAEAFVSRLVRVQSPSGTRLHVFGNLESAGGLRASSAAAWDGATWSVFGNGFAPGVNALARFADAGGDALYAVGRSNKLSRWDGTTWSSVAQTNASLNPTMYALASADLGGGAQLYVTGRFTDTAYRGIAAWNGTTLSPLGAGLNDVGLALVAHDDGNGPRLFVGGSFRLATSGPGNRIAAWDGTTWSSLGGGAPAGSVNALARYDEGAGTMLVAGGTFTIMGGNAAARVARWNGSAWSALGAGVGNGEVDALAVFGGELYAAGAFTLAGGAAVNHIARYHGGTWSDLPGGGADGPVFSLGVHDDGRGPALYAGGSFTQIGGVAASKIARFDGATWSPVDGGVDGTVRAFASIDDDADGDQELFVAGDFEQTATFASGGIARLEGCPHYTSFCAGDGSLTDHTTPCPCASGAAAGHGCANSANANGGLLAASGDPVLDKLELAGSDMPATSFGLYMQHSAPDDRVFHDGVVCAGGTLTRLRGRSASAGTSRFPDPSFAQDATISIAVRGQVVPGSGVTRYYSLFYRNTASTFCPPATANVTNGVRVIW